MAEPAAKRLCGAVKKIAIEGNIGKSNCFILIDTLPNVHTNKMAIYVLLYNCYTI